MNRQKSAFAEHLLDNMTWPEKILWSRLKRKQLGYSFQRQAIVCGFIPDFWCYQARVVVEVDGTVHEWKDKIAADKRRDEIFLRAGITVLRFTNEDVREGISAVLLRIWKACYARKPIPLKPLLRGNPRNRRADSVEFAALQQLWARQYADERVTSFAQRYRAKRAEKSKGASWWRTAKSKPTY